ncbi:MerR family transcriptional regulator [Sphingomicrobium lutaoense]|uniref:DNA-binding transcriptional MerR regulator n=1 Tax=Sphingomicrobium lutaoense TaxID=515949 RepID=A0A839YUW5_9SPHN|nr:MerR family transcriptional regulator [Sphingomicrobium lutaoense]MBB3763019.1 DNA-binding transcriptional MerR regulator [Sphingomicrobium lutaoense]
MDKEPGAFLTIGELADELGVAQHILRYWETKFPQLKPLKRAGNRRYYRPADVAIAKRIRQLLNEEGYTVKGAQKALREDRGDTSAEQSAEPPSPAQPLATPAVPLERLRTLRDRLQAALDG